MKKISASIEKNQIKKIVSYVGKALSILSIVFVAVAIYRLGFDVSTVDDWKTFIIVMFFGAIIKCITVFISGSAWADWVTFFANKKINSVEAICVYAKANIGKYLPGNVMHYVERNIFSSNLGISQKKIAVSTLLEIAELVFVALILSLFTASKKLENVFDKMGIVSNGKMYLFLLLSVVVICLVIFLKKKVIPILNEYSISLFVKSFLITFIKYSFELLSLGAVMVLLYFYLGGEIDFHIALVIISSYIVAWVVGFITPGASGGLGVRELIIIFLLEDFIGKNIILTLTVTHRLVTILGDFLAYFLRYIYCKYLDKEDKLV